MQDKASLPDRIRCGVRMQEPGHPYQATSDPFGLRIYRASVLNWVCVFVKGIFVSRGLKSSIFDGCKNKHPFTTLLPGIEHFKGLLDAHNLVVRT